MKGEIEMKWIVEPTKTDAISPACFCIIVLCLSKLCWGECRIACGGYDPWCPTEGIPCPPVIMSS